MDVRYIVALSVTVLLVLPGAAAVHGEDEHRAGCQDGVSQDVEGVASVDVDPGDDCGVSYDSGDDEIRVTPTFDRFQVSVTDYPYVTSGLVPNYVSPAEGVEHPVGAFLRAVDETLVELGVAPDNADVRATDEALVIEAEDQQAEVEWPEDPRTGEKLLDDDRIYVPPSYQTSSDEQIQTGLETLQGLCSTNGPEPACSAVDDVSAPAMVPTVTVGYRVSNVSLGGTPIRLPGTGSGAPMTESSSTDALNGLPHTASRPGSDAATPDSAARVAASSPGSSLALPGDDGTVVAAATVVVLTALGAAVLYRRLTSEDVLDHPLRSEVFEYIKEHPGVTTQELSEALDVDYSTAGHHVSVLGDFDLVHAQSAGRVTHYFENHGTFDAIEKEAIPLLREGTSAEIARIVGDEPRITSSAIARKLDVDPSTVKWHADKLRNAGVLESEPLDGRSIGFVVADQARDVVEQWT